MSSGRLSAILVPVFLITAAGCREDPDRAIAQVPSLPAPPAPGLTQPTQPTQRTQPMQPTQRTQPMQPTQPTQPTQATQWDVGAPWRLALADVPGRGVRVERIEIRSFALPLLEAGDFIIGVDERQVTTADQLQRYLGSVPPGSLVVLAVRRGPNISYVMLDVPDAEASP